MRNNPIPQQIYKHFKGNLYQILTLAEHSENGEKLVIYQALYGEFKIYARPLSMFMEKVDKQKYPEVAQEYRFELQVDVAVQSKEIHREAMQCEVIPDEVQEEAETLADTETEIEEELQIDPLVLDFLDAGSYEERLNILEALHHRITDDMINTMAVAIDVEVNDGEIEQRYAELRQSLLLFDKFECSRLR